jgi:phosphoribosylformylglycinamidine synthase subunit PurQ / glutaminase
VHWSAAASLPAFDAYVLPGGFAYEDRIRAGAVAAHDVMLDHVIAGAQRGKLVLGICNGAQILLEAGLVPGTGEIRRPTAAFTKNGPEPHFVCRHVYVKLAIEPSRSPITAALSREALIPAWTANGEGRLAAHAEHLREIEGGNHIAFIYAHEDGSVDASATPNQSALGVAALVNRDGNVLAIMPHPERDFAGGPVFFKSFVEAVHRA